MDTNSLKESVDANADDILDFLERDIRSIHAYKQQSEQPGGMERTVNFYGEREGNTVSIYAKTCGFDRQGNEIIRFEVTRRTESMSNIKAFYECNNSHFVLMFYKIWSRLAIAFGAGFAGEALRKVHELEQPET